jgi:hypothetical protein
MKKIIGILFILLFVSCGSKKVISTSAITQEANVKTAEAIKIDSSAIKIIQSAEEETKQTETETTEQIIKIEFDTEKPLNPETNLPPIKSIEIKAKGLKSAENTAKTTDKNIENKTNFQEQSESILQDKTKTKEQAKEIIEKKESQKLKWTAAIIFLLIALALLLKFGVFKK